MEADLCNAFTQMSLQHKGSNTITTQRRIIKHIFQMCSVVLTGVIFLGGAVIGTSIIAILYFYECYYTLALYMAFYALDFNRAVRGGRRCNLMRHFQIWKLFQGYFPIRLIKTTELDPRQKYIIGYHPHGVISCGAFASFATEAAGFSRMFKGIVPHLATLNINFRWPFVRDFLMALGMVGVDKLSFRHVLKKAGNAIVVVIGGAQEVMEAHPGSAKLVLKNRYGFVKEAIRAGAALVPAYAFGENDLFTQIKNPPKIAKRFQMAAKKLLGIVPPLIKQIVPSPSAINVVVGSPITVTQSSQPSNQYVEFVKMRYQTALKSLYDKNRRQYSIHPAGNDPDMDPCGMEFI